jgi:hypothetical protein
MTRGKPRVAHYGDKGGVYIPDSLFGNEFDLHMNAVVVGLADDSLVVVFLDGCGTAVRPGDIKRIDKSLWRGKAFWG